MADDGMIPRDETEDITTNTKKTLAKSLSLPVNENNKFL